MKRFLFILFSAISSVGFSQTKPGTSFYGETNARASLCPERRDALSENDVNNLITEILWKSYHIKNSYIIINCTEVANCQAAVFEGKPYILYNPNFLGRVKKLNFSPATLPGITDKDWETLTILAHELGHHLNGHLTNPKPDAKQWDQELEADETAGYIIHLMNGTLAQAQLAFKNIPERGDYTHPGRQKRLDAVAKGWNDANPVAPVIKGGDTPVKNVVVKPVTNTGTNTISDNDGNIYNTIKIDEQVWMQSNLNVSTYLNGDPIPQVTDPEEWAKLKTGAWCYYKNDSANKHYYGKLYNSYAITDKRGLAPKGWHIPESNEVQTLVQFLGGYNVAGGKLKDTIVWWGSNWREKDRKSNNSSGFSALPGGYRDSEGDFTNSELSEAHWWISSVLSPRSFWLYNTTTMAYLGIGGEQENKGYYVRCVKDADIYVPPYLSPNGDGIFDIVKPDLSKVKALKNFSIYNSWGQRVFYTEKAGEGWNGKTEGKKQSNGAYYWTIEFISNDGSASTQKGSFTLIR